MTSAAHAATIANRGDKEVKLTFTEGASRQEQLLQPGQVVEGVCQKGCIIRLNDSAADDYELDGSEILYVEEGFLYYGSSKAVSAPVSGSGPSGDYKGSQ